jgi:hypothetical protein
MAGAGIITSPPGFIVGRPSDASEMSRFAGATPASAQAQGQPVAAAPAQPAVLPAPPGDAAAAAAAAAPTPPALGRRPRKPAGPLRRSTRLQQPQKLQQEEGEEREEEEEEEEEGAPALTPPRSLAAMLCAAAAPAAPAAPRSTCKRGVPLRTSATPARAARRGPQPKPRAAAARQAPAQAEPVPPLLVPLHAEELQAAGPLLQLDERQLGALGRAITCTLVGADACAGRCRPARGCCIVPLQHHRDRRRPDRPLRRPCSATSAGLRAARASTARSPTAACWTCCTRWRPAPAWDRAAT